MNPKTPTTHNKGCGGSVPSTATDSANPRETLTVGGAPAPVAKLNYLIPPPSANVPIKRIIRKITPIDPKKLKQYGLDRKIAEAVSKHKLSQLTTAAVNSNKSMQKSSNIIQILPSPHTESVSPRLSLITPSTTDITPSIIDTSRNVTLVSSSKTTSYTSSIVASSKIISSPTDAAAQPHKQYIAKTSVITKNIIPPKITITAPEAPTEMEIKQLEGLNSQQRLIHVKNLLNKKLLQKKTSKNDSNVKLYKELTPPSSEISSAALQVRRKELLTIADKVVTKSKRFVELKDEEAVAPAKISSKVTKTQTPQKSPKDIARKLDFQGESETRTVQQQQVQRSYKKSLSSEICTIPKASLKNSHSQDPKQIKQTNFSYNTKEVRQHEKQKIDFPEMSPLKIQFPTANVPQETPLPAIDSFKKPYTLPNASYYNSQIQMKDCNQTEFLTTNYGNAPPVLHQSTIIGDGFNTQLSASSTSTGLGPCTASSNSTNCLIVLENKVLSQDEMIDLTELRLSTSKVDKPRFATPHKPIPEVVIKQENSEECPTTLQPLLSDEAKLINAPKEINTTKNLPSTDRLVISTKQNKKIIINAQKLKLPPDQLANLAKQIAQRTGVSRSNMIPPVLKSNKSHGTKSIDSNAVNNNTIINTGSNQNNENVSTNSIETTNNGLGNTFPVNYSSNNVQISGDSTKNDNNYQTFPTPNKQFIPESTSDLCNHTQQNKTKLDSSENKSHQFIVIVKEEPRSNDSFRTSENRVDKQKLLITSNMTNNYDERHAKLKRSSICYRKPAVEIIDEPVPEKDCFSAVDFIAALDETNPITAETSLELSPEELNLNASFAMSYSPLRINPCENSKTHPTVTTSNVYSPLPPKIGNIVDVAEKSISIGSQQMSTIAIDNSNGSETTVLRNANKDTKKDNTSQNTEKSKNLVERNDKEADHIEPPNKTIKKVESSEKIGNYTQISVSAKAAKDLNLLISNELAIQQKNIEQHTINNITLSEATPMSSTIETVNRELEAQEKLIDSSNKPTSANSLRLTVQDLEKSIELPTSTDKKSEELSPANNINTQHRLHLQKPSEITQTVKELGSASSSKNSSLNQPLQQITPISKDIVTVTTDTKSNDKESGVSKTNEKNSISSVTSKRISRFKKGKINLVQRNKSTPGPKDPVQQTLKKNDKKPNDEDKLISSAENIFEADIVIKGDKYSSVNVNRNDCDETGKASKEIFPNKFDEVCKDNVDSNKSPEPKEYDKSSKSVLNNREFIQNISDAFNKSSQHTESMINNDESNKFSGPKNDNVSSDSLFSNKESITANNINDDNNEFRKVHNDNSELNKTPHSSTLLKGAQLSETMHNKTEQSLDLPEHQECEKFSDIALEYPIKEEFNTAVVEENPTIDTADNVDISSAESSLMPESKNENCSKIKDPEAKNKDPSSEINNKEETTSSKENMENLSCRNISQLMESNKVSPVKEDILVTKKHLDDVTQPKISLVDIVKYSPTKVVDKPLIIPFKKHSSEICQSTPELKGIKYLLKQLKSNEKDFQKPEHVGSKENNEYIEQCSTAVDIEQNMSNVAAPNDPCVSHEDVVYSLFSYTRSSLNSANTPEKTTTIAMSPVKSRDIHSTQQLVSGDNLDFLPGNANTEESKLTKSPENTNTKPKDIPLITTRSPTFLGISPSNIVTRRTRLYSKPSENELVHPSTPTIKRTRFNSQSLEIDKLKLFETSKCLFSVTKNTVDTSKEFLTTEESCQDSTHDEKSSLTPTKQRRKLRKTLVDIKKSQNSYTGTESEEDSRDFGCTNECEESNEFLGFEEDNTLNSLKDSPQILHKYNMENISLAKTKGGTLKNWLTTGKAISPTLSNERHDRRTSSLTTSVARSSVPLKKRLDLSLNLHEETDITDDTSPADDDGENKSIFRSKRAKRRVHDVIFSDKNVVGSKKIKLDKSSDKTLEHIFTEPRQLRTNSRSSCSESDFNDEKKTPERLNCKLTKDVSKNIKKEIDKKLNITIKTNNSVSDSDSCAGKQSKRIRMNDNIMDSDIETSGVNANFKGDERSRRNKSKKLSDKLNKVYNIDDNEKEKVEKIRKNSKELSENSKKPTIDGSKLSKQKSNKSDILKSGNEENKSSSLDKTTMPMDSSVKTNNKHKGSKRHKLKDEKHKTEIQELNVKNLDSTKIKENTDNLSNSEECLNATVEDTEKSLPYLDKKFKKKKKSLIEADKSVDSKNVKLVEDDEQVSSKQVINSMALNGSPNDAALVSQRRLDLKRQLPGKGKLKIDDSDCDNKTVKTLEAPSLAVANKTDKIETPKTTSKRGKKPNTICNFNPRLLLITKREQLDTNEVLTESQPSKGPIQCGLCLDRMVSQKWSLHLAKHYGVGWKIGEEKLHIENRQAVFNYINAYLKEKASDGLNCRMCNKTYRSGAGLLTHIEACGMPAMRVTCEFCKREYAQSSLPIHLRSCHVKFTLENEKHQTERENLKEVNEVFGNTGRIKRHSTIKAESKLKVIENELDDNVLCDNKKTKAFQPKDCIKYVPAISEKDCKLKWAKEIKKCGKGSCPKKFCKFTSQDLKELAMHLSMCKYIKSGYLCKPCRKRVFKTEKEALDHVTETHQKANESDYEIKTEIETSSDEYELSGDDCDISADDGSVEEEEFELDYAEDERKAKKKRKTKNTSRNQSTVPFQRKKVFDGRYTDLNGEVLRKWKNFLKLNYAFEQPLFVEFSTEFSLKENQQYFKYLPSDTKSMKFNIAKKAILKPTLGEPELNIEWSELNRFESINNKFDTYYYLGAPIKFCSWLPLPKDVEEQYLLVAYRSDKFTKFLNPKQHCTVLLIFKVTQNKHIPKLKIHYGFIVHDGPVHNVAFLPSGGYDKSSNRLGLVAVATINSSINVYALPINVQNDNTSAKEIDSPEDISLIDVKPKFCLNLDIQEARETDHILLKTQCLRICWSEFSGHKHIFASFSNGFIGIWDISNDPEDNLNRYVVDGIVCFVPVNYFYLGEKGIKCFALHYDTQGPRWLAVAGLNRKFVIYDIKNFTQPIILKDDCAKNIILSMDWCQSWETVLYSYCDAMPNNGHCVMAVNPTNVMFTQLKLDLMVAGVTQVHYSPLTNMCVASGENGDLLFLNSREMHYDYQMGKEFGERRILSAIDIKQLNGEKLFELPKNDKNNLDLKIPTNWSMYDNTLQDKHGLIFQPFLKLKENMKKNYLNEKRIPSLNILPLLRINTLRCNLNLNAKYLVAVGHENGFLRLIYFNKDTQMD